MDDATGGMAAFAGGTKTVRRTTTDDRTSRFMQGDPVSWRRTNVFLGATT
jgi:hypothetical protein